MHEYVTIIDEDSLLAMKAAITAFLVIFNPKYGWR